MPVKILLEFDNMQEIMIIIAGIFVTLTGICLASVQMRPVRKKGVSNWLVASGTEDLKQKLDPTDRRFISAAGIFFVFFLIFIVLGYFQLIP